ncbi:MAG TPA: hypothetical protein PK429_01215 [Candidatus Pacearchaeota archaeon]|nr:hypothetical protein [Candidatus Pacearchaeota archaeon]HPO06568.1 hypothetical protein [Candidatus Pacearchaeota archaeon]
MSIRLKLSGFGRNLLVFILGIVYGLSLTPSFGGVEAQEETAPESADIRELVVYGDAAEFKFCGKISRAVFIEPKTPTDICSKAEAASASKAAARRMKVVLTAYSSTVEQTDSTPFITANGTYVRDGIVANNGLPFGTEIRIPELFGEKVFSVQDRMHWRKGGYHFDIWFPTYEQAKNFGVKYAYVEVLEK